jgi:hypothetical protein
MQFCHFCAIGKKAQRLSLSKKGLKPLDITSSDEKGIVSMFQNLTPHWNNDNNKINHT